MKDCKENIKEILVELESEIRIAEKWESEEGGRPIRRNFYLGEVEGLSKAHRLIKELIA